MQVMGSVALERTNLAPKSETVSRTDPRERYPMGPGMLGEA